MEQPGDGNRPVDSDPAGGSLPRDDFSLVDRPHEQYRDPVSGQLDKRSSGPYVSLYGKPRDYSERLQRLLIKHEGMDRKVASAVSICAGLMVMGLGRLAMQIAEFTPLLSNSALSGYDPFGWYGFVMVGSVVIGLIAMYVLQDPSRNYYSSLLKRRYQEACSEIKHSDVLTIIADGYAIEEIYRRIDAQFGLRWLCPSRPQKIEDSIDFAACFYGALQQLREKPETVRPSALRLGACSYQIMRVDVNLCCCFANYCIGQPIAMFVFLFFSNLNINRCARAYALVDYLTRRRNFLVE